MDMKNRKLKFGLGVASVVFGGMAIPLVSSPRNNFSFSFSFACPFF
jgi:hypothetical protein